jgi:hypothetical protein
MNSMIRLLKGGLAVCAIGALALAATDVRANLLANPGFEDPVTSDGPPFVGFWEAFNGGGAASFNSATDPLSGLLHLELQISATANTFAGAFQDVPGLSAGQEIVWSGWSRDVGTDAGGTEVRIEWRDSVADVEIARTPNLVPTLTGQYTQWSVVGAVPAGADLARVVYAIQSFGAGPNQNIYVDDTSVTLVPEPTSLALLGLGGLAMLLRRRA